jgi:hypothetical protein
MGHRRPVFARRRAYGGRAVAQQDPRENPHAVASPKGSSTTRPAPCTARAGRSGSGRHAATTCRRWSSNRRCRTTSRSVAAAGAVVVAPLRAARWQRGRSVAATAAARMGSRRPAARRWVAARRPPAAAGRRCRADTLAPLACARPATVPSHRAGAPDRWGTLRSAPYALRLQRPAAHRPRPGTPATSMGPAVQQHLTRPAGRPRRADATASSLDGLVTPRPAAGPAARFGVHNQKSVRNDEDVVRDLVARS